MHGLSLGAKNDMCTRHNILLTQVSLSEDSFLSSVERNEENATKDKSLFISGSIWKSTCEPTNSRLKIVEESTCPTLSDDLQGMNVPSGTSMHPCELQPHF